MARPISNDLRKRVLDDVSAGMSRRQAAKKYSVSPSFVVKLASKHKETGDYSPKKMGGDRRSYLMPHKETIVKLIEKDKSITLVEMAKQLESKIERTVSKSAVDRFLHKIEINYKKNSFSR